MSDLILMVLNEQILLFCSADSMYMVRALASFTTSSVCVSFTRPSADFYDVQTIKKGKYYTSHLSCARRDFVPRSEETLETEASTGRHTTTRCHHPTTKRNIPYGLWPCSEDSNTESDSGPLG